MPRERIDADTLRDTYDITRAEVQARKQVIVNRKRDLKTKIDERFQDRLDRIDALLAEFDVV